MEATEEILGISKDGQIGGDRASRSPSAQEKEESEQQNRQKGLKKIFHAAEQGGKSAKRSR